MEGVSDFLGVLVGSGLVVFDEERFGDDAAFQREKSTPRLVWFGPHVEAGQSFASTKSFGVTFERCGNLLLRRTPPPVVSGRTTRSAPHWFFQSPSNDCESLGGVSAGRISCVQGAEYPFEKSHHASC